MGKKGGQSRGRGSVKSSPPGSFALWGFAAVALLVATALGWKSYAAGRDAKALTKLRAQLAEQGGNLERAVPATFDYGGGVYVRGLATTQAVPKDSSVVGVPRDSILADFTIDGAVVALVAEITGKNPHDPVGARDLAVAAGLLREKALGEKSDFSLYVESMPAQGQLENLPLWDVAQMDALSSLIPKFSIWRKLMLKQLEEIVDAKPQYFGFAGPVECQWALSMIISRQVHGMLMPVLDLANHRMKPNAKMDCNPQGCRLLARRDLVAGEEVTITYGDKPNLHLLQAYGFAVPGNDLRALRLDQLVSKLGAESPCGGGLAPVLDHAAPLAVNASAVACLEKAAGRCKTLKALEEECAGFTARLLPPEGRGVPMHQKALGLRDVRASLKHLSERQPGRAMDGMLLQAVRDELATLERCSAQAQAEWSANAC